MYSTEGWGDSIILCLVFAHVCVFDSSFSFGLADCVSLSLFIYVSCSLPGVSVCLMSVFAHHALTLFLSSITPIQESDCTIEQDLVPWLVDLAWDPQFLAYLGGLGAFIIACTAVLEYACCLCDCCRHSSAKQMQKEKPAVEMATVTRSHQKSVSAVPRRSDAVASPSPPGSSDGDKKDAPVV